MTTNGGVHFLKGTVARVIGVVRLGTVDLQDPQGRVIFCVRLKDVEPLYTATLRTAILDTLRSSGASKTATELAESVKKPYQEVRYLLRKMVNQGLLDLDGKKYRWVLNRRRHLTFWDRLQDLNH